MNQPVKPSRIGTAKKTIDRAHEQLRKRLIDMIRRNEAIRREKPR